jgi:hypothetical protein
VLLPGCWLQPNFDAGHSRNNGWETTITAANVAGLTARWSVLFPARAEPQPLISGGRVFVQRQDGATVGVLAIDAGSGAIAWDRTVSPAGATNVFTNYQATIIDGELWQEWHGTPAGSTTCSFGTVRLGQDDGSVHGEDRSAYPVTTPVQSGRHLVRVTTPSCDQGTPSPPPLTLEVSDSVTHQVLWTANPIGYGQPSVSGGQVITPVGGWDLAGCGAATCPRRWSPAITPFGDQPVVGGPGNTFFVLKAGFGGPNGEVRALSRADGTAVWGLAFNAVEAEIAVDGERLYVATSNGSSAGYLLVYDVDGCGANNCWPLWSAKVAPGAWAPTVAGDVVYVAGSDGKVHAFRAAGCGFVLCGELGSFAVTGGGISSLAVADGRLVVSSIVTPYERYRLTAFALPGT